MAPVTTIALAFLAAASAAIACDSPTLNSTLTSYLYAMTEGDRREIDGIFAPNEPYTPAPYTQNGIRRSLTGYRVCPFLLFSFKYPLPFTLPSSSLPLKSKLSLITQKAIFNQAWNLQNVTYDVDLDVCVSELKFGAEDKDGDGVKLDVETKIYHDTKYLTIVGMNTTYTKLAGEGIW